MMEQSVASAKALKFRALAEQRVSTVIRTLRAIAKLSRRSSYEYTPDQVAKIFNAMRVEIDAAEQKFVPEQNNKQAALFRLD